MPEIQRAQSPRRDAVAGVIGVAATLWLGYGALGLKPPGPAGEGGSLPALAPCAMATDGYLRGRLHGSSDLEIDWSGAALACAGSARPDNAGLRLFFAGAPGGAADRVVLVIGIDAGLDGLAGAEHAASVTLIDEASSQFFHSGDGRCFTRVDSATPLPGERYAYRIEGSLWCVSAIAAVAGTQSVTLSDIAFAGRLVLDDS